MPTNNKPDNAATRAGHIERFNIYQHRTGKFADVSAGCVELYYYEDILSNSISATAVIVESGLSNTQIGDDKGNNIGFVGILDNLPIRGGEQVQLVFRDNKNNPTALKFLKGRDFYVKSVREVDPGTQKDIYYLDLCTRESISNEQIRVVKRYDGSIAENIHTLLKSPLSGDAGIKTPKKIESDPTVFDYNFIGNDRKPFYIGTWLASKSVPVIKARGKNQKMIAGAAGYFFFETYDGFKFKAIDILLKPTATDANGNEQPKLIKKFIFSNTPDLPPEYDAKILAVDVERDINLQRNLAMGAYANRTLLFDFVNMDYKVENVGVPHEVSVTFKGGKPTLEQSNVQNAGKKTFGDGLPNDILRSPSRLMSRILDIGTLPPGKTAKEQLKYWRDNPTSPRFKVSQTMAQAAMRYNQLFAIKTHITIAGDFSLKAGDLVHCDFPQLTIDRNKETNKQTGGLYLIASVCHRMTPDDCFSRLTLVRDTFGRKPSHSGTKRVVTVPNLPYIK